MTRLRRLVFHNAGWKLASLAVAAALWFVVVGEPELITVQAVRVFYRNLPPGMLVTSEVPDVQLELRGPSAVLDRENLEGIKILLDLSRVTEPGEQSFTISSQDVSLPAGVSFLSAVPSRLFLKFDRRQSREVPVRVEISGAPAPGYRVAQLRAEPDRVLVSGPAQRLESLENAVTDPVDVSGRSASLELQRNAYLPDALLQLESPSLVSVRVTIEKGIDSPDP
jgi:diadenylate cyclase